MAKGKVLGIDYGTTKIGLAVSDDARLLAFGRGVLDRAQGFPKVLKKIQELCEKEKVTCFVFGLPLNDEGEEGDSSVKIRNFASKLRLYFPDMPIAFIDESFSTFQAKGFQRDTGYHGHDDEFAATIILQRYLDSQAN